MKCSILLFDDSKKLEKTLGEEAAAVTVHAFERADEKWRQELATKADIQSIHDEMAHMATKAELAAVEGRLAAAIANSRSEIIKWFAGLLIAQAALVATPVKLL